MQSRREFLTRAALAGASGVALSHSSLLAQANAGKPPMRFIFLHKGNGLHPDSLIPRTFTAQQVEAEKRKESMVADLDGHELPEWMEPLSKHREHLTILQGLSGKMCTTGHHTWCSSLGAFKANERLSSIKWATVDFELANLFPSAFGHIEFACFPTGGGNARGNINGIEKGFSASGPQQPNYAFGSPRAAIQELFKSVSPDLETQVRYQLETQTLDFVAQGENRLAQGVSGSERVKVDNYADALKELQRRNGRVEAMGEQLTRHLPQLDPKYLRDDLSTVERQEGLTEVLLATLISGMTNVVAFTLDELATPYTGLSGIEGEKVNQHDVGHGKPVGSFDAAQVRKKIRHQHMRVIDTIVSALKSVPEAGGTMFDNTMLLYFPDNGETHHSRGSEWPFVVLCGDNSRLDIARRYIRLPAYDRPGHKTLGNWYTTLLNAFGNDTEHYGAFDVNLSIDQKGPIADFIA